MFHSLRFAACAAALVASTHAQVSPLTLTAEKVPGAVRHAGIYHLSTGTWTRTGGAVASFGPDTIYSNTAASGYFSSVGANGGVFPGSTVFDEGIVPSTLNTNRPGNRDAYNVNCFEVGYCDLSATGVSGWELAFYTSNVPCTGNMSPDVTIDTGALPIGGCWTIAINLTGGREFCLGADGGDGFNNDVFLDSFGWSYRYTGTGAGQAGFLLSGDPSSTDPTWVSGGFPPDGTNTYFGPASLCSPDEATGLGTGDYFWLEDPMSPTMNSNCYWFGGYRNNNGCGGPSNPWASWHMELQADLLPCGSIGQPSGCTSNPNSTGVNSSLFVAGSPIVTANNVTLTAVIPRFTFGFFITDQNVGFIPNPGGSSGNLCLGANIGRFQLQAANSGPSGILSIATTAGQWSLASIPQGTGPYAAQAGGTAVFQCWHRDSSPSGPTSNFTDGVIVTWQ